MGFLKLTVRFSRQQIIAAAVMFILASPTVESLIPNLSTLRDQRHRHFPSSSSVYSSPKPRSGSFASSLLSATSLDSTQLSSSDLAEDDTRETEDNAKNDLYSSVSKFRQLKDVMWIREALEDYTAAEFALSVEQQYSDNGSQTSFSPSANSRKTKKRAVDYEKLMAQLTKRIEEMTCQPFVDYEGDNDILQLDENLGMGRYAYTNEERTMLMESILKTRENLSRVIERNDLENPDSSEDNESSSSSNFLEKVKVPELADLRGKSDDSNTEEGSSSSVGSGPKLYIRDDGTVDWEGALQDRAALKKFGGSVWARINGQTPDDLEAEIADGSLSEGENTNVGGGAHHSEPAVVAKIEDTPAILKARKELVRLEDKLKEKEKAHTALVESGIRAGQTYANVKLASVDPALRNEIRRSADALQVLEQRVSHQNLVYELERIYTYLVTELENPTTKGYIPLQDRLYVAEYGLLESQIESCSRDLNSKGALDADILAVIAEQMTDFKRRLGIDYYVTGLTYDREAISRWLNDLYLSSKEGLNFYVKGIRLFFNDIVYCVRLIGRAVRGVTLQPREVRTIRRTFKDIITFIPFVIIWSIPISPVGHALVFGAIQKFYPEFFPSSFTDQRQNLLQLYETTEFSEVIIKESLQERITRFFEALTFVVEKKLRNFYQQLTNGYSDETDDTNNSNVDEN